MSKIILASNSPRRSELLTLNKIEFEKIPSSAEESNDSSKFPQEVAISNALLKAKDVAKNHLQRTVLGADTIVVLSNKVYGKPKDLIDAQRMLSELSGKTHIVYTAIALVNVSESKKETIKTACEASYVTFKSLNSSEIDKYLQSVNVLDKAGAYAAQEFGSMIIEKIDGNFDNVMGLPCELVKKELDTFVSNLHSQC